MTSVIIKPDAYYKMLVHVLRFGNKVRDRRQFKEVMGILIGRLEGEPDKKGIRDVIIEYLKKAKLVPAKAQFVNDIKKKGFSNSEIENEINSLKEQGIIQYSRAKPKGWSLS